MGQNVRGAFVVAVAGVVSLSMGCVTVAEFRRMWWKGVGWWDALSDERRHTLRHCLDPKNGWGSVDSAIKCLGDIVLFMDNSDYDGSETVEVHS